MRGAQAEEGQGEHHEDDDEGSRVTDGAGVTQEEGHDPCHRVVRGRMAHVAVDAHRTAQRVHAIGPAEPYPLLRAADRLLGAAVDGPPARREVHTMQARGPANLPHVTLAAGVAAQRPIAAA
ncbi:hypothetical protein GCM10023201_25220 [Actinomycetospora corticicola]